MSLQPSNLVRLLRRDWRRSMAQRRFPGVPIGEMPILFGNSFPKSGTHLLTQILGGFSQIGPVVQSGLPPFLTFTGRTGRMRSIESIKHQINQLKAGDIAYGHLHAFPEVVEALSEKGTASYFIYRDPRDVVVSHVYYVRDINSRHAHHDYYVNELKEFGAQLRVSILGRPEFENPFPNISERFRPYLDWLNTKEVLSLRFEDMLADNTGQLAKIWQHALARGFPMLISEEEAIAKLSAAIDPQRSPTFRSGKSGTWRVHFTDEHKDLFKEASGNLLIRLGYEENQNW